MINKAVYAELRDILDTRLASLALVDIKLALKALEDDNYVNRLYDEYDYLTYDLFRYYQRHNLKKQLLTAFPSKLIELINVELDLLINKHIQANETNIVSLDINTYPYKLSDKITDKLKNALIISLINPAVEINFFYKRPIDLTLAIADTRYDTMFMYYGNEWLDYHVAMQDGYATNTKLYIPSLLVKPIVVKKENDIKQLFQSFNSVYKPYIDVTTIPTNFFHIRDIYKEAFVKRYVKK